MKITDVPELGFTPRLSVTKVKNGHLPFKVEHSSSGTAVYLSNDEARALGLYLLGITKPKSADGPACDTDRDDFYTHTPAVVVSRLSTDGKTVRVERWSSAFERMLKQSGYLDAVRQQLTDPNPLWHAVQKARAADRLDP